MRRRGFTVWGLLGILTFIGIAALILYPVFKRARWNPRKASCQSNLKQVGLAVFQYTQDYSERYPLVNVNDACITADNPLGWADAIQPYLKSTWVFVCPTQFKDGQRDETRKNPSNRDYTDYFYNRRLVGVWQGKVDSPSETIMLGEGNDETDAANARYSLNTLPAAWLKDKNSPSYRHLEGANYAFADGHVKWFRPVDITDKKPDSKTPTFAIN